MAAKNTTRKYAKPKPTPAPRVKVDVTDALHAMLYNPPQGGDWKPVREAAEFLREMHATGHAITFNPADFSAEELHQLVASAAMLAIHTFEANDNA